MKYEQGSKQRGARRTRRSKRRRARKLNGDRSSESGGRMSVLQFVVDGSGDQLFLVAQHGVLMDSGDSEHEGKGGKLGRRNHEGGKIWG